MNEQREPAPRGCVAAPRLRLKPQGATRRRRPGWFSLALLLIALPVGAAQAAPERIVSINLCTDQLLLMLAERQQIASVSYLAADPNHSFMATAATGLPMNHGELEELLSLKPDLVLAHAFSPPDLLRRLRSLGLPVEQVAEAVDLEGIRAGIRQVAGRIDAAPRGEALIEKMDREIAEATAGLPAEPGPRALFYHPNGYTNGVGTLQDTALRLAGWRNAAAESGLSGFAPLDLEALVRLSPMQLFTSGNRVVVSSREGLPSSAAERLLAHPVVVRAGGESPPVEIDYRHWICGGPMIAGAVRLLAQAHVADSDAVAAGNGHHR